MTGSLAFRKSPEGIRRGDIPAKFLEILPFIPGQRVLEIGSAEGVLALLMAREGKDVTALEKSRERHECALDLGDSWRKLFVFGGEVRFMTGSIADNADLLMERFDTLVCIRSIYYFGADLDRIFSIAAKHIRNVVLCGNGNRASRWRAGNPDPPLGEMNRYASREGMTELLERHGYRITRHGTANKGDEIVVGRMG